VIPRGVQIAAIIAGLAAIVAFVPHGGSTADFIGRIISIALTVLFVLFGVRLYQMFRSDIYGLGDRYRAILYGAIASFILAMAWRVELFDTTGGSMLWIAMIAGAMGGLYATFMHWRSYRI
jgi:predicted Na+-dependent transporter